MECERIEAYEQANHYTCYGESCRAYGRDCEFYGICHMNIANLSLPYDDSTMKDKDEGKYMIELSILDIIDAQLIKGDI